MKNRSRLLSLACVSACSMLYSAHSAFGVAATFNAVVALDPNAATSANANGNNYISVTDAASNNQSNGVNFATFNTLITNAFANNSGGVLNFGDGGTLVSGPAANTTIGDSAAHAITVNYGTSLANQFSFYRSDSAATATNALDYNNNNGTDVASGTSTGDYLGIQGTSTFSLTFVNPLEDFGITMLPRGSQRTSQFTIHYSNGTTALSSSEQVLATGTGAIFFGFQAPAGLSITSVDNSNNGAVRFDDLAFVVAPVVIGSSGLFWTNAASDSKWSSANWSTSAAGTGSAVTLPTNGSTGVTFTASSITSGVVSTILGANQNVSSIAVNTSASAVTVGGTNNLAIGSGGITLVTATPLTINTSGGVYLSAGQSWNSGTSTLTVSSAVSSAANAGLAFLGTTGTTILSGPNTYTGLTSVQGGTLQLANATAIGGTSAQLQIATGAAVDLQDFNTTMESLSGTGGVITSSTAGVTTLTIAATPSTPGSFLGAVQNGGGTMAIVVNSGGILTLGNSTATQNYSGGTTVNGGGTLNVGVGSGNTGTTLYTDNTLGTGPVTIGSATTPVATVTFNSQATTAGTTMHGFSNTFSLTGNTLIQNVDGENILLGTLSVTGLNNTIEVALLAEPVSIAGGLTGSGSLTLAGYNHLADPNNGGGGYFILGSSTSPTNNTGFTGTITANNAVTTDNSRGAQIVAMQNALLPNGTIAFTGDLPVLDQGASGFNGSAISFAAGVTAPQIGALSSSTGGAIALVSQAGESVNLTLGLNNSTGSSYAGNLYDGGSGTPGSLTKVGTNQQILTGSDTYVGGTNVAGGTLSFASPTAFPNFTSLTIGANASAGAANFGTGPKNTLFASGLSIAGSTNAWTGKLDLANNDMVVQNGSLATLTNQVAEGFNNGTWNGSGGIVSSAAASDTTHLHALGVILNSATGAPGGTELYSAATSNAFDGATADASTDVLIKYTYYGDTNLDGKVDGTDYSRIDSAYLSDKTNPGFATGWYNGDFNYDGVINGSDYTLIDNAFNRQGAVISTELATSTAQIAGGTSVPEPTSLALLGIGALGVLSRRRRRLSE